MEFPRQVYLIKHNTTNRIYIGSSYQVEKRIKNHLYRLRAHTHHIKDMQDDFDVFGENYTFDIIGEIFNIDEKDKEYEFMEKFNSRIRGVGYNYLDQQGKPVIGKRIKATQ